MGTVSGHLKDPSGTATAGSVTFLLTNYIGSIPRVIGTNAIVDVKVTFQANASGVWSGNLTFNDTIDPGGTNTPPTTYYAVTFKGANGQIITELPFQFTGAGPANLDSQAPLQPLPSPFTIPNNAGLLAANQTWTGVNIFTGANVISAQSLEGVLFADQFSGSDMGAKINAAYAALPSSGGKIYIPSNVGAAWNYSIPIVCSTAGKYVLLEGWGASGASSASAIGGVVLNYTPTTATTALTLDYATTVGSPLTAAHGLRNLTLINNNIFTKGGSGSSAIGISNGATNAGCYEATMDNVSVLGFGTGWSNTNTKSVDITWINPQFFNNTTAILLDAVTSIVMFGGTLAGNGAVFLTNSATATCDVQLYGTAFFNNSGLIFDATGVTSLSGARLDGYGCHFENSTVDSANFLSGNLALYLSGGIMEDDNPTGTINWFISSSNQKIIIDGVQFVCPRTCTTILNATVHARGVLSGFDASNGHFTSYVSGSNAQNITQMMLAGPSGVSPAKWSIESPLWVGSSASVTPNLQLEVGGTGLIESVGSSAQYQASDGTVRAAFGPQAFTTGAVSIGSTTNHALGFWTNNTLHGKFDTSGNFFLSGNIQNVSATAIMGVTLKKGSGAGDYTTASTSYVDVDGTNLAYTVTIPTGWKLSVVAQGSVYISTAAANISVSLLDTSTIVETLVGPSVTTQSLEWSLAWVIAGDGASHTVKLQWKTSAGADAANMRNASSTLLPTMVFTLMPSN